MNPAFPTITPVILCGGSGTRLWPLSRKSFPKQFVPLIGNKSLLQLTMERVALLSKQVVCVAAEDHRFLVAEAMAASGVQGTVLLESAARNTAAAMTLAALRAQPADVLLFCPADHHIPDANAFAAMAHQGLAAVQQGAIVIFGVVPSFPSTAYGYIERGAQNPDGTSYQVARFIEKPPADKARALILQGDVLWNGGIFLTQADTLLQAMQQHAPDILQACTEAMSGPAQDTQPSCTFIRPHAAAFEACRSESIDYGVMEHHPHVAVVPFAGAWSDVGSWNAVADLSTPDEHGNRIEGQGLAIQSQRTFIHAPHRMVVSLGTQDLLVIDTPDALLVAASSHAEQVKSVVAELEYRQSPKAGIHRKVARPWGWYDSIDMGARFQVKRIMVKPGASLSLQMHHHRAEHWIVVSGTAEVTNGDKVFLLTENQSTYIPVGAVHRLNNPGITDLEMIEVQSGSYLGEDDIVRLEDTYGRVPQ
jgi:mannose-1-phosphate guanylyltransferase/mannose-6-phosphate isomerase